jgi:ABC-2 type transport system ATP-binding protein
LTSTAPAGLAIATHGLQKAYGDVIAVNALDLAVPRNSIAGFLGPNGAGKSTTIRLLLGLIRPTAGSGSVLGLDVRDRSMEVRRRVGYLAQQPRFYPELMVRETVEFAARFFFTGPTPALRRRTEEALELVGMGALASRRIGTLSGGELQRVGIAQAWINRPELLILDEPASALDPAGRRDVLGLMATLREQSTIFFSTHILDDVQRVADHVVVMARGRLVAQGPMQEFLRGGGTAAFAMTTRGSTVAVKECLARIPWVTDVHEEHDDDIARWRVTVDDARRAEGQLLRHVLAADDVDVLSFNHERRTLEDVFLGLVDGAAP